MLRLIRLNATWKMKSLLPSILSSKYHSVSSSSDNLDEVQKITRIINDHPFPDQPLSPTLVQTIPVSTLSTSLIENVLGRLFASHSNGLKALEFFRFSLEHSHHLLTSDSFEKTLHILVRMRYFDKAWELMEEVQKLHPSLLTIKSMAIMLAKIAKFKSFEDTFTAYERMENTIFVGKKFGIDEFNVLLRSFCTQRQMKEARAVFNKMYSQFSPNTTTMNILLVGFKESGDITAVELFYHEMVKRGFKPNAVTYHIRIDVYCKSGSLINGVRILKEMESAGFSPTVEIMTTLIHGAGIIRDLAKAKELFDEISKRNLNPNVGAYNALMSSMTKCKSMVSAEALMEEMNEKGIEYDTLTYHYLFFGLMKTNGIDRVVELYEKMTITSFLPMTRTIVMLMKFFCHNRRPDMGLRLWDYVLERGYCPHGHAVDLLATSLCSHGRVEEAFVCCKQVLERGRSLSDCVFKMMENCLRREGDLEKLFELEKMMERLQLFLPPSSIVLPN
ncbi:pentatricopeptide repeat-containing protein At3g61360 [Impatiens glandulifera]|uniref:pentatricopeptide repeat-containing protein At3g61360 n=1 Tax=Impatiens glandulifera TaxID=253017 RepID=UPI001FB18889|nr:pentatricopeptide repeat-containing protein At3g61360 [Impatiens glandulifera]